MKCSINIGHIKVNSLNNNSSINFGPSRHDNYSVDNAILIGTTINCGDQCFITAKNDNRK